MFNDVISSQNASNVGTYVAACYLHGELRNAYSILRKLAGTKALEKTLGIDKSEDNKYSISLTHILVS